MNETRHIPLSQDAALVVALAGTAMSFSHSAEDEAERWLRALRLHGHVGAALQALGIGEAPLMTGSEPNGEPTGTPPLGSHAMERVALRAEELALKRASRTVGTVDLLFAVFEMYGRPSTGRSTCAAPRARSSSSGWPRSSTRPATTTPPSRGWPSPRARARPPPAGAGS